MAFKKIDFSKLDRSAKPVERNPYETDDALLFRGKKLHRVTVDLTFDRAHSGGFSNVAYRATHERNGKTENTIVVFTGQRAEDFREGRIHADLQKEHEANCDKHDFDAIPQRTIIVEGTWKPRNWKDRDGNWHKDWELHAAQWHYSPDGEQGFIEEGALPFS